jgi:predicted GNAT family acetyltransferase
MVIIMCFEHDPNIIYAYTLSGALSAASLLQARLPNLEIIISHTVIPNEFGHPEKALMILPVYPDNVPF